MIHIQPILLLLFADVFGDVGFLLPGGDSGFLPLSCLAAAAVCFSFFAPVGDFNLLKSKGGTFGCFIDRGDRSLLLAEEIDEDWESINGLQISETCPLYLFTDTVGFRIESTRSSVSGEEFSLQEVFSTPLLELP